MSVVLLEFAKSFAMERLSARVFSDAYIELWKIEGDKGFLQEDAPVLSECLSSIFCVADMYCEDDDAREQYELDDVQLRSQVRDLLKTAGVDFN